MKDFLASSFQKRSSEVGQPELKRRGALELIVLSRFVSTFVVNQLNSMNKVSPNVKKGGRDHLKSSPEI